MFKLLVSNTLSKSATIFLPLGPGISVRTMGCLGSSGKNVACRIKSPAKLIGGSGTALAEAAVAGEADFFVELDT